MAYETIIVETKGHVGLITLNRPKALNALNAALFDDLNRALDGFEEDPEIGAIVITGSERAFAAGADIKEMQDKTFIDVVRDDFLVPWDRVTRCRKPVIAAVAGYALGGGCELAMMCDIVIAADNAKFGQPEITIGTIPGSGGTQRLTRAVGKATAMDVILSGRFLTAQEALAYGLVSRVVPVEHYFDEAMNIARTIAEKPPLALRMAKDAVLKAHEMSLSDGLEYERKLFYMLFATDDQTEGMAAFLEKRAATFTGQ